MKSITTTIANVEVEYHYTYSPGTPASGLYGRPEDYDEGSGSEIDLEGPFIGDVDIGPILNLLLNATWNTIRDEVCEQIELAEADAREDARHAADEDRYERLRDERAGV